ncbi:uncharacterized protein LOC132294287 [Cornus florida]|uniref:uncharacterized protein LOC132294287 n=1 Tax=Cornus florida TaxID=4283 RepID=UPI002899DFDE|nr:uncharacterized protein LOC132294287 [Cornus florida]
MEEKLPRANKKRSLPEDDDSEKPPAQKRVRFPKGKKVKPGVEVVDLRAEDGPSSKLKDPRLAAKDRATRRSKMTTELFSEENRGMLPEISAAEVQYEVRFNKIFFKLQICNKIYVNHL